MTAPAPRIVDNDLDEITATLDGKEIRGWSYEDETERRWKMRMAREFVEGWLQASEKSGAPDMTEALRIATDALDGLSYIHDGNPSDAMADTPPLDYARHMLFEARQMARAAASEARSAIARAEGRTDA